MFVLIHMYGLMTKCEVKMIVYWPSSFDGVEVYKHGIKQRSQYQAILTIQKLINHS